MLRRATGDRLVAGVSAGLAEHLGVPVLPVRVAFAALALLGGNGLLLYAGFWMFVPKDASARSEDVRRDDRWQLLWVGLVAAGGWLLLDGLGSAAPPLVAVPLVVGAGGVALLWGQADDSQRSRWRSSSPRQWSGWLRIAAGVGLVAAGVAGFLAANDELGAAREGLVATAVVVAGLAVVFAPWALRLVRELGDERRERIRAEERATVAAYVHDSVLQTLTLIQRQASSSDEVSRLARRQERELRSWLYGRPSVAGGTSFAAAVEAAAADIEDLHGVPIEVVTVGDRALDERASAVVLAAREAMANGARLSGAPVVSVYAECTPEGVTVFVRDTGCGFDPDAIAPDRRGITESVVARMARVGGRAVVRSAPGDGTEVELVLERGA